MNRPLWLWLLLPPAVILSLLSLALLGLILSFLPPLVSWVAVALLVLVVVWFFFGRQKSAGAFSESTFATKATKEGLL